MSPMGAGVFPLGSDSFQEEGAHEGPFFLEKLAPEEHPPRLAQRTYRVGRGSV